MFKEFDFFCKYWNVSDCTGGQYRCNRISGAYNHYCIILLEIWTKGKLNGRKSRRY